MSVVQKQSLTESSLAAKHPLGYESTVNGKVYKYVQFKDAVTYAAGQPVSWDDQDGYTVTNDISSMEATTVSAAGVALGVMTTAYYGFIQTKGLHTAVLKKAAVDSWTADDIAILSSDTDGVADKFAFAGTTVDPTTAQLLVFAKKINGVLGQVAGASNDTADTVPILLDC